MIKLASVTKLLSYSTPLFKPKTKWRTILSLIPGLLPIFEFWGPLHHTLLNFGPGGIAHRRDISGHILLMS